MSALISRFANVTSMLRIAAFLLALAILAATPGFTSAHGANDDEVYIEDVIAQAVGDLDQIWDGVLADYGIEYLPRTS